MSNLEDFMGTCMESYNDMVDAHMSHSENIAQLKTKVENLEDCSRRNHLKVRGILKSVLPSKLPHHVQDIFHATASTMTPEDLTIDRI